MEGDDLVIPDTKNDTTHRLPLTDRIRDLYGDGFTVKNGRHVTERLEELTDIHLTPHDLRRTFAAIANHAGVPDYTISMLMNHKKTDITGRYVGRNRNTMELALMTVEDTLSELVEAPVEPVWDVDDMSIEARLDRLKKMRERANKRREAES